MSSWQGVKLFYMHFAQMEMSMESVGGCQRGSSGHSLLASLLLSCQPYCGYSFTLEINEQEILGPAFSSFGLSFKILSTYGSF